MPPSKRNTRSDSSKNDEEENGNDNNDTDKKKKISYVKKDPDQWIFLLNDSIVQESPDEENKPVFCRLRHPRTGLGALFLFAKGDKEIYEVTQFKEENRSWFIGNYVQQDGSLFITTPVDPVFLVLPYFIKMEKTNRYMTAEQIIYDDEFSETSRLCNTSQVSDLHQVSQTKGSDSLYAYKFDKEKTLSWLKIKTERVAEVLEEKKISVCGAHSATFVRSKKFATGSKDEYLRYAHGMISEYLPQDLSSDLRQYLGIPSAPEKRQSEAENPPSKKVKLEDITPTEDYSKMRGIQEDKAKSKSKLSAAQKKLSQVDKTGMKSISSFFSPKSKT
ncbi:hypothetical protein CHS0354_021403 [Potamilus streckersoni]|uniref:Ribonuclease H2 subunit B n=1 Tax=Potamilus streckersoni TaxID=2493646 RepID=A0AAE0S1P9_9BIVA|nr:hypothetical protein CHS0354_021403 [Potamilus streckersoni]